MRSLLILTLSVLGTAALSACSQRTVYESIQQNRLHACERLEGTARDECLQQHGKHWDDYQRERGSVIKPESR